MSLSDYVPPTAEVTFRGGSFTVRGLSLEDISTLIGERLEDLETLYALYQQSGGSIETMGLLGDNFLFGLARKVPGLVAQAIALAADEPVDLVRRLSFPLQAEALVKIGTLTFEEVGGIENFTRTARELLARVGSPALPSPESPAK